jgi:hypothetical protein
MHQLFSNPGMNDFFPKITSLGICNGLLLSGVENKIGVFDLWLFKDQPNRASLNRHNLTLLNA